MDLISRQALLDSFRKCYVGHMGMEQSDAMMMFRSICKVINEQPSAQPEIIYCKDCRKHNQGINEAPYLADRCPLILNK